MWNKRGSYMHMPTSIWFNEASFPFIFLSYLLVSYIEGIFLCLATIILNGNMFNLGADF